MGGAAGFGCEYLQAADSEDGQHCNREHDDSQTAYPLRHAAPEQKSMGKRLYVVQYGGSRTGKAGHGFKKAFVMSGTYPLM